MSDTVVDRLFGEAKAIEVALAKEPSLQSSANDNLRKALLLAAASNFEHRMTALMLEFVSECSNGSALFESLVRSQAIQQKYHTWFVWDGSNANKFFSMFGADFKAHMASLLKQREDLTHAILAFLEIGNERNRLVHMDFATFPMEKTIDEIYGRYKEALPFVDILPGELRTCDQKTRRQKQEGV